jgi:hypothetical protein
VSLYAFWFAKIKRELILNHPHCTVFPYVRKIAIDGNLDDGYGHAGTPRATWLDGFLLYAPKFTGLTSLELHSFTTLTSNTIIRTMPPVMKRGIRSLITVNVDISAISNCVSNLENLTTLTCGEIHGRW